MDNADRRQGLTITFTLPAWDASPNSLLWSEMQKERLIPLTLTSMR